MDGRGLGHGLHQRCPALLERRARQVIVTEGEQVEGDELGGGLTRELAHPRLSRMQPQLQGLEVEPPVASDDYLSINDAPRG